MHRALTFLQVVAEGLADPQTGKRVVVGTMPTRWRHSSNAGAETGCGRQHADQPGPDGRPAGAKTPTTVNTQKTQAKVAQAATTAKPEVSPLKQRKVKRTSAVEIDIASLPSPAKSVGALIEAAAAFIAKAQAGARAGAGAG